MFAKNDNGSFVYAESLGITNARQNLLAWQKSGLQYTRSGYGSKIPTTWQVKVGSRWHRVYCTIHSNSGTCYIVKNGQDYIVNSYDLAELVQN